MAVTLISSSDTCASTAGSGMVTTWTLAGQTETYKGDIISDGYKITASMTWQALQSVTADLSAVANSITNNPAVIGTCVETLTDEGYALQPNITD